jgi:hypothetical protein
MSDLNRSTLIAGVAVAIALGAAVAWWTRTGRQPERPAPDATERAMDASESGKPPLLYKWQDDAGVWTYTDKPPADRDYEQVIGTPNVTPVPTVVPEVPVTSEPQTIPPPSD